MGSRRIKFKRFVVKVLVGLVSISVYAEQVETTDQENNIERQAADYWDPVFRQPAVYPRKAQEKGMSGCVFLTFTISHAGKAENIVAVDWHPDPVFVQPARKAVAKYRWLPTAINTERWSVQSSVKLEFKMKGKRSSCDSKGIHIPDKLISPGPPIEPKSCTKNEGSRLLSSCS